VNSVIDRFLVGQPAQWVSRSVLFRWKGQSITMLICMHKLGLVHRRGSLDFSTGRPHLHRSWWTNVYCIARMARRKWYRKEVFVGLLDSGVHVVVFLFLQPHRTAHTEVIINLELIFC